MEQKKGAIMILDQLAERERQRADAEEARRLDGEEMKRRIQALKDEESKVRQSGGVPCSRPGHSWLRISPACSLQLLLKTPCPPPNAHTSCCDSFHMQREEERKAAGRALMDEVARGNAALAERKRQAKAAELEEEQQIAEYIRQRDAREQVGGMRKRSVGVNKQGCFRLASRMVAKQVARLCIPGLRSAPRPPVSLQELAEERDRAAKAKELEVARLRAMQEKIQDNRAALVGVAALLGKLPNSHQRCCCICSMWALMHHTSALMM